MAIDNTQVNGVKKSYLTDGNTILYSSFLLQAVVNVSLDTYTLNYVQSSQPPSTSNFADIIDKKGATDIEGYVDELCNEGFFFEPASSGGATDVNIVSQTAGLSLESKQDTQILEAEETNSLLTETNSLLGQGNDDFTDFEKRQLSYLSNLGEYLRRIDFLLQKISE